MGWKDKPTIRIHLHKVCSDRMGFSELPCRASAMSLPFTTDQFLDIFAKYNVVVWPVQSLLYLLGVSCIVLALRRATWSSSIISLILSLLWLWMGVVYHFLFFSRINQAAWLFGAFFILQSLVFVYAGLTTRKLSFHVARDAYGIVGALLLTYVFIIYPALGYLVGHRYPRMPTFGLPCPTTIFTFGMLLWASPKVPGYVLIVPLVWSLIGFFAALSLSIHEDFGLLAAGIAGTTLIVLRNNRARPAIDANGKSNFR